MGKGLVAGLACGLWWGAAGVGTEPVRYESAPALGLLSRIRDALRSIFP